LGLDVSDGGVEVLVVVVLVLPILRLAAVDSVESDVVIA
jgi:hypothetical protein